MAQLDILIPTYNRPAVLAVTLTALAFQRFRGFSVIIADQSDQPMSESPEVQSVVRLLAHHDVKVRMLRNIPRRGIAQQRQFLLEQSTAGYVLYIDDDVVLEPFAADLMLKTLQKEKVGFTGMPLIGLSYRDDIRPHQQSIEFWDGPVQPETVSPGSPSWNRYKLHNAANALHVQQRYHISPDSPRTYKVAWIGGCAMYASDKLRNCGGFEFWQDLPEEHCGEDVLAQLRVMKRYGGCGILPSGAYHQELPTTLPQYQRRVDAPKCLTI